MKCLAALVLIAGLVLTTSSHAARVALVIGNQDYLHLEKLQKSAGDAMAFGDLFEARGFDRIIVRRDLARQEMDQAIAEFLSIVQPGDTAVFVYSGHGWSDGVQNYLVGIDAPGRGSEEFLKRISVPLKNGVNGIIDGMAARGATLKVAIIDACRDNPFESEAGTRSIGISRGLNRMLEAPPEGTFLVFSAGAGQVALDRLSEADPSPNGLFTRTFLPLLAQGMTLLDATKAAQEIVFNTASAAGYAQQPSFYDETRGNKACLWDGCSEPDGSDVTPDELAWLGISRSTDPLDFESFARLFPDSPRRADAEARAKALLASLTVEETTEDPRETALKVQEQLRRLGCYAGRLDGQWGPQSRRSLARFGSAAGLSLGDSPDADLLALLVDRTAPACVVEAVTAPVEVAPTSGCFDVAVTVDQTSGGNQWERAAGDSPDPRIAETTTGAQNQCSNTFNCSLRITNAGSQLAFVVVDVDEISRPDPIGSATCAAGRSCRLEHAAISMSPC